MRVLVVAPVGAYIGRVKKGISWALATFAMEPERKDKKQLSLVLVVSQSWNESDSQYASEVKALADSFRTPAFLQEFKDLKVEIASLEMDDERSCVSWLVTKLLRFFAEEENSIAYVDVTSAPKEWLLACQYVSQLADNVVFYFVKPRLAKSFKDYTEEDREDEGTIPQRVWLAERDFIISRWLTKGTANWNLFKTIWSLANNTAVRQKIPVDQVRIPEKELLAAYSEGLLTKRHGERTPIPMHKQKAISKLVTDISRFGLFERKPHSIMLTEVGLALAESIFSTDRTKERPDARPSQHVCNGQKPMLVPKLGFPAARKRVRHGLVHQ